MKRPSDIDLFESYIENNKVVERNKDISQAESLFAGANRKFSNMERLGIDEETATDYFENVYESIKNLIQSFMSLKGFHPYSHEAIIAFAIEYLEISPSAANKLNKFRKLRNDISYRGDIATAREAENIKDLFENLREDLEPKLSEWKH